MVDTCPPTQATFNFVIAWWSDFTSECFKREKEIGGSLIAYYDPASKSRSVISITFYLLGHSKRSAPDSGEEKQTLLTDGEWQENVGLETLLWPS